MYHKPAPNLRFIPWHEQATKCDKKDFIKMIQTGSFKKWEISGRFEPIYQDRFHELIHEYDDVTEHKCRLRVWCNRRKVEFETAMVGRNYERINEFVKKLNVFAEITETEYGKLKNGSIE